MVKGKSGVWKPTIIGSGVKLEAARLSGRGPVRIDGDYTGDVESETLTIGKTGCVTGGIRAKTIVVAGWVKGDILSSDSVRLTATARVEGCLETRSLSVETGAKLSGKCLMSETRLEKLQAEDTDESDSFDNKVDRFINVLSTKKAR